jgi:hypothetical protein
VRGAQVEKAPAALIERRSRKGEIDPDEREELWKASVARHNARRQEETRAAWREHHEGQAVRLRAVLGELIANHEEQAERYRNQLTKGE